jgi:hypothetical protein
MQTKIQIVSNMAREAVILDDFEAVKAAGYELGQRDYEHSLLRDELRGHPTIKGFHGPMWGGWRDAEGQSIYFENHGDGPDGVIVDYSPSKGPVDHYLLRYEDAGTCDLLSR